MLKLIQAWQYTIIEPRRLFLWNKCVKMLIRKASVTAVQCGDSENGHTIKPKVLIYASEYTV